MNKSTYLINWLEKEPLRFSDMNRLLKSTEKINGEVTLKKEYRRDKWRQRKDYQGYWNTSLRHLTGGLNPIIKKNDEGKYEPTEYGLENKLHPFARTEEDLEKARKFRAERIAQYERTRFTYDERVIELTVFENDEYKLIKKVTVQQ